MKKQIKKILITGKNSYIGESVKSWLTKKNPEYQVEEICLRSQEWLKEDFSKYDVVFHVAGIAHSDIKETSPEQKKYYYKINTTLTETVAKKAKAEGVKQFIYMSSMIVFGASAPLGTEKIITSTTEPRPLNYYGDSKLQAEIILNSLKTERFKVVIIRPPMVYGRNSKGNYPRLSQFAKRFPVFPKVVNSRSIIHIDNLSEFIRLMILNEEAGIFHPQNAELTSTSELVKTIAIINKKKIVLTRFFNPFLLILSRIHPLINKVFGSMAYELSMSEYNQNYRVHDLVNSIEITELYEK